MKISVRVQDILPLDDHDLHVGGLVVSKADPHARGLVVEFLDRSVVTVLWSTPPSGASKIDARDIW